LRRLPWVALALFALALTACIDDALPPGTATPQSMSVIATNILDRSGADRPDEVGGFQIHVVYAIPSDGIDRGRDQDGEIARSVAAFETWLDGQTGGTKLLLDTAGGGGLDVSFVRLAQSDAEIAATGAFVRDRLQSLLRDAGLTSSRKLYAVYYDGTSSFACGGGAWPPNLTGNVAAEYLQGLPQEPVPCSTNPVGADPAKPGYIDISMLHEIFHTLGAVPACAPHHTLAGHVSDSPSDLMYAGNEDWRPATLDVGRDDYYGHAQNGCLDIADSAFLNPQPPAQQLPPGW
jgi:hypothetical protein